MRISQERCFMKTGNCLVSTCNAPLNFFPSLFSTKKCNPSLACLNSWSRNNHGLGKSPRNTKLSKPKPVVRREISVPNNLMCPLMVLGRNCQCVLSKSLRPKKVIILFHRIVCAQREFWIFSNCVLSIYFKYHLRRIE